MTYEEDIEILRSLEREYRKSKSTLSKAEALVIAIDSVEKQVAKEPSIWEGVDDDWGYECPLCKKKQGY